MHALGITKAVAEKFGVDLRRRSNTAEARLVRLLKGRGITLVLDIGANRGQYGTQLRSHGYAGRLVSFEPLEGAYSELSERARRDDAWQVHRLAMGDCSTQVEMNVAANQGASSSLLPMLRRHERAAPHATYVGREMVSMRTVDSVWDEVCRPTDRVAMKIDTQGFEGQVLKGAQRALCQLIAVQLELSVVPLYEGGLDYQEGIQMLESRGFVLCLVSPGFTDPLSGEMLQFDGLFMRRDS